MSPSSSASFNFHTARGFFLVLELILNCLFQESYPLQIPYSPSATYKGARQLCRVPFQVTKYCLFLNLIGLLSL